VLGLRVEAHILDERLHHHRRRLGPVAGMYSRPA
jgi:hypothetical protein